MSADAIAMPHTVQYAIGHQLLSASRAAFAGRPHAPAVIPGALLVEVLTAARAWLDFDNAHHREREQSMTPAPKMP